MSTITKSKPILGLWRVPNTGRKTLPKFVPVIFANGNDDDLPGFEAAVKNVAVQYREKIYQPGEPIEIVGTYLRFTPHHITILGAHVPIEKAMPGSYVIREGDPSRHITVDSCTIWMGGCSRGSS